MGAATLTAWAAIIGAAGTFLGAVALLGKAIWAALRAPTQDEIRIQQRDLKINEQNDDIERLQATIGRMATDHAEATARLAKENRAYYTLLEQANAKIRELDDKWFDEHKRHNMAERQLTTYRARTETLQVEVEQLRTEIGRLRGDNGHE